MDDGQYRIHEKQYKTDWSSWEKNEECDGNSSLDSFIISILCLCLLTKFCGMDQWTNWIWDIEYIPIPFNFHRHFVFHDLSNYHHFISRLQWIQKKSLLLLGLPNVFGRCPIPIDSSLHIAVWLLVGYKLEWANPTEMQSGASSKQASASHASEVFSVPTTFLSSKMLQMVSQMRNTMDIRDRNFNNKMYSTCFSAASIIDWLLVNGFVDSRREGVTVCQELVSSHTILPLTTSSVEFKVVSEWMLSSIGYKWFVHVQGGSATHCEPSLNRTRSLDVRSACQVQFIS